MGGLLFSGCLLTVAGVGILAWAVVDPEHLFDGPRSIVALLAAPFALVIGIRRLRRAADAP